MLTKNESINNLVNTTVTLLQQKDSTDLDNAVHAAFDGEIKYCNLNDLKSCNHQYPNEDIIGYYDPENNKLVCGLSPYNQHPITTINEKLYDEINMVTGFLQAIHCKSNSMIWIINDHADYHKIATKIVMKYYENALM